MNDFANNQNGMLNICVAFYGMVAPTDLVSPKINQKQA